MLTGCKTVSMSGRANHVEQIAAMTSMLEVAPHAVALKVHLRAITESPAFKGSRRSQEFLQFVVARALDGHFDDLKERVLGVELFGRSPSYDTGDDAIVRVTPGTSASASISSMWNSDPNLISASSFLRARTFL